MDLSNFKEKYKAIYDNYKHYKYEEVISELQT